MKDDMTVVDDADLTKWMISHIVRGTKNKKNEIHKGTKTKKTRRQKIQI